MCCAGLHREMERVEDRFGIWRMGEQITAETKDGSHMKGKRE
jgi:hypothetical protein